SYTVNTPTDTRRNGRHLNRLPPTQNENNHLSEETTNPSSKSSSTPERPRTSS
uniref:Uncharacterized protein n=1 Tax=Amphimedon queenslandica TaxID=400682 RepID=A0A1X7UY84_AMPQE